MSLSRSRIAAEMRTCEHLLGRICAEALVLVIRSNIVLGSRNVSTPCASATTAAGLSCNASAMVREDCRGAAVFVLDEVVVAVVTCWRGRCGVAQGPL